MPIRPWKSSSPWEVKERRQHLNSLPSSPILAVPVDRGAPHSPPIHTFYCSQRCNSLISRLVAISVNSWRSFPGPPSLPRLLLRLLPCSVGLAWCGGWVGRRDHFPFLTHLPGLPPIITSPHFSGPESLQTMLISSTTFEDSCPSCGNKMSLGEPKFTGAGRGGRAADRSQPSMPVEPSVNNKLVYTAHL